jgi:hypothetical protein
VLHMLPKDLLCGQQINGLPFILSTLIQQKLDTLRAIDDSIRLSKHATRPSHICCDTSFAFAKGASYISGPHTSTKVPIENQDVKFQSSRKL